MPAVDLGAIPRDINMMVARIGAVESYAKLEQALCRLFASLIGAPIDKAAIVFYRLTNTHSRNAIFEALLAKAHGDRYDTYWYGTQKNGLITLVRQLDGRRNEIVHWHGMTNIEFSGETYTASERLVPPNVWAGSAAAISTEDLNEFIRKADFTSRSISMFDWITTQSGTLIGQGFDTTRDTWLRIFEQPVSYPPESTHPLSPNRKAHETPPQPSGA